jgi:hypothetical protein
LQRGLGRVVGLRVGQRDQTDREHHDDGQCGADDACSTRDVRHRRKPAWSATGASELTASVSSELRTACASVNDATGGSTCF